MYQLGLYIDLDNIYGACLDHFGIKVGNSKFLEYERCIIEQFLYSLYLIRSLMVDSLDRNDINIRFVKAFAEFENLPFSKTINIQQILSSVGIKLITPFYVKAGKRKNKNASDIQLALEVATDLSIKRLDLDGIAIFSGDIDMYPVASWIKEHFGRDVYIVSYSKRINSIYQNLGNFVKVLYIDELFRHTYYKCRHLESSQDNQAILKTQGENIEFSTQQESSCDKFIQKTIEGLKNWLKKNDYATTGLIITNWLPRWDLDIGQKQANECLKRLIEEGLLDKEGIVFQKEYEEGDNLIGRFFLSP